VREPRNAARLVKQMDKGLWFCYSHCLSSSDSCLPILPVVKLHSLNEAKGKAIAEQINKAGGKAISVNGDVTDPAFPDRLVEETIK
jgi:hypothetical protein